VTGHREQVHAQFVDADRDLAHRLRGIGVHDGAGGARRGGNGGDGLHRPGLVVGEHHRDERRPRTDKRAHRCRVDAACGVDPGNARHAAFTLQEATDLGDRRMLDRGNDELATVARRAQSRRADDRVVVGLGAAAGENDGPGAGAQQFRGLGAGLVDRRPGATAGGVAARGIGAAFAQPRQHGLEHARVERCRRVVVQIEQVRAGHDDGLRAERPPPPLGVPGRGRLDQEIRANRARSRAVVLQAVLHQVDSGRGFPGSHVHDDIDGPQPLPPKSGGAGGPGAILRNVNRLRGER
jgi:hypothetical protein